MSRTLALWTVVLSVAAIGAAYASAWLPGGPPGWAAWAMAMGNATLLVATMSLGAMRDGRLGRLVLPFALVLVVYTVGFGVVLALPPADPQDPTLWLGLPPRAAVILYGIGILPMFAVPLAYALTFDEMTLSEADLERVRRVAREIQDAEAARAAPMPGDPAAAPATAVPAAGVRR